jgi:hypothetical protein
VAAIARGALKFVSTSNKRGFDMRRSFSGSLTCTFLTLATFGNAAAQGSSHLPPCRVTAQETALEASIRPIFKLAGNAATGEPAALEWNISNPSISRDAYLVVALPEAIRLRGNGFIAVPPNARATRSIRSDSDKTRLIVPLTGPLANTKGAAELIFFESGPKRLDWTIVQLPSGESIPCVERVLLRGQLQVDVRLGAPQLVTQNRYPVDSPKSTYVSADSRFLLQEFNDRYQIIDRATGDLLFDHAGTSPRFSQMGRYVTSFGGSHRLEVLDILAQQIIFVSSEIEEGNFGGVAVAAWMDNDAALILGYGSYGAVGLTFPLIDKRNLFSDVIGCHACHAFGSTSLFIDLDQFTIQAFAQEAFQSSMLEVADAASTIEFWDSQKPEERGPSPRRPKFPLSTYTKVQQIADQLKIPANGNKYQNEVTWTFSDRISVSFFNVWNGDVAKQKAVLSSKSATPRIEQSNPTLIAAIHGRIAKRMIEVGGAIVSPPSFIEQLTTSLTKFNINTARVVTMEMSRPKALSADDYEKRTDSALPMLRELMATASKGRAPLILRKQATSKTHKETLLARNYGRFSGCQIDEGPKEDRPWLEDGSTMEEPPIISADRLVALWRSQIKDGTVYIAQQTDRCGSALDRYGDLISVLVSADSNVPIKFKRIAASYSDAGAVSDPSGIDATRSALGAALRLTIGPSLLIGIIDGHFAVVTSKDSGVAAVFDLPSMELTQVIEGMENPLDIATVTMTADHGALVQINNTGAISFFDLSSNQSVLKGRYIDDELVVFDKSLNYESTPEGAAYIYVRVPGNPQLFTLDQFASRLMSTGVGLRRLHGDLASSDTSSGLTPPSLHVQKQGNVYIVKGEADNGLANLLYTVDGQVIQRSPLSGLSVEMQISADSIPSGRWVNFVLEDRLHLRSVVRTFELGDRPYSGQLNVFAFGADAFGGGRYRKLKVPNLMFASTDAKRFEAGIKTLVAPSYSAYASKIISGVSSDKDEVLLAIKRLAEATKRGDTFALFFASHGFTEQGRFSILLPGPSPGGEVTELPFSLIADALKSSQGRIFVFLDACHSADAAQDAASEQLASSSQDITIITASKGPQSSLESSSWGGGIFTTAVLQALRDQGRARAGGPIRPSSIEELYSTIRGKVVSETRGRQTPWLRRSDWRGAQSIN